MKIYEKLDPEFKAKLLAELRSGNYKQGDEDLYNPEDDSFCCLGVAGCVAGVDKQVMSGRPYFGDYAHTHIRSYIAPKYPAQLLYTTSKCVAVELAIMNDNGASFSEIADWIEANL